MSIQLFIYSYHVLLLQIVNLEHNDGLFCHHVTVGVCLCGVTVCVQEKDLGDEYGWKQVHGDVFRPVPNCMLFASLVGTGYHVAVVCLCVIVFALLGHLYTE